MKVILLGSTPPPVGGIAKWTVRMINSKLKNNWEVVLVDEKVIGRDVFGDNVKTNYCVEITRWTKIWLNLIVKLFDKDVKIVHSCPIGTRNSMLAELVNILLARLFSKKVVLHFRCTLPNMIKTNLQRKILKYISNKADYIFVLNTQTKDYLDDFTNIEVEVVPNFVDIEETIRHSTRKQLENFLYVGGCTADKGCLDIINIAKYYPEYNFYLVGNPESIIVEGAKSTRNVYLEGVKNSCELKSYYENADVFLFLSHFEGEGFSNSLAEAMGAGLPCIVTDWAANSDMIENGKGGFVVDMNNIENIRTYIEKMKDHAVRKSCSEYNYRKTITKYRADVVQSRYVDVYEEIIGK